MKSSDMYREEIEKFESVRKSINKIDGINLVTGKPVYTSDLAPKDCLVVKILRSPHAFAKIKNINTSIAMKVPGVECVLTWKDVPRIAFTRAGQSFPEPSTYDKYILDEYVRYIGDEVAIVAAADEESAMKAMKAIKVDYEVLEPVLDPETAVGHPSIIHPDTENYHANIPNGVDFSQNIAATAHYEYGDIDDVLSKCEVIVEDEVRMQAQAHAMMEPYKTFTYMDMHNRLVIVSSTQIPFHIRRTVGRAIDMPASKIRVIKPRIGGGFGGKQTGASEYYPAIVTKITGKPAILEYDRVETFNNATSRHNMKVGVKIGADKDGTIKGVKLWALSDQGAYGEHTTTTVGPVCSKVLTMYNKCEAVHFDGLVVYTNKPTAGAFRGFGVTQGVYAVETGMNKLAHTLGMDPTELRNKNMAREGEDCILFNLTTLGEHDTPVQKILSCGLHDMVAKGKELIGWDEKYPGKQVGPNKFRGMGMCIAQQGSGIPKVDSATAEIRFQDQGFFTLLTGATDIGTGSDTILKQIAADAIGIHEDRIEVISSDTDLTPFDVGAYASSTTYVSGNAIKMAGENLRKNLFEKVAEYFNVSVDELDFDGDAFSTKDGSQTVTLEEFGTKITYAGFNQIITGTGNWVPQRAAPPYMAGFAEVEVDTETGEVDVLNFVGMFDCGTPINPKLAKIQAEGGIVQGIGLALCEDVKYDSRGRQMSDTLMEYKIPSRDDMKTNIIVDFVETYDPTGPYGAKSIGEVVINCSVPSILDAIYNATGAWMSDVELPMTPEKVLMKINEAKRGEQKNAPESAK
ncbi:putative molybdenum-binding subunit of oxidoreductase [Gottschalkia acidurici 9a]|uniref:Molybdenum-binding subunit of oxidoreductase n=1 Tax=Gottschalkia acidurici (strain ATCC 7906 / DSM 604 / BCRC 14475 / CIP 104303 / KCTC 5404 / NCIMB 10678 / 9a) TaxID=1128398 RepID=K0AZ79_GOTA9|nr:molybdopterin cofactor-binding domain-containing protein [Gottschalkia acidurici]AFS78097.1 putative molybdenum-binding subunit of oxidoreductase [Gottschalkia acidurici 9a]